jgi:hypothetical protein
MDIKTASPEQYAEWLRTNGVPEAEIPERMAHDMLRVISAEFGAAGAPEGFDDFAKRLRDHLSADALARALGND